jgi:hypothetical protein
VADSFSKLPSALNTWEISHTARAAVSVLLGQAADAYTRMMKGKARFRMVLVTKDGVAQSAPVNGEVIGRKRRKYMKDLTKFD